MVKARKHAVLDPADCVACGSCVDVCPREAIHIHQGSFGRIDVSRCVGCGRCVRECPASIIRLEVQA